MPKIQQWAKFPDSQRRHLIESNPDVPMGDWFKDFGSFELCGEGAYPKTFLLLGQSARGTKLEEVT